MKLVRTYFIQRDGKTIWLSHLTKPLHDDKVLEERPMVIADEGKVLTRDGEVIGEGEWLQEHNETEYSEVEKPPDEEENGEI